ncbi:hypothetical protein CEXT_359091 [Caerostris extrusa]|uniref:Uncharacterized protein n=1 Tax=Caerostris extrusa TaxID=172846 RepID=A0AAV4XUL6_CAEEX|nr:hypothetical protein CEXT_359091 [Caerostris extrusa]
MSDKKKADMGDEELTQAVLRAFSYLLKEHALMKATSDVAAYRKGNLRYMRRQSGHKTQNQVFEEGGHKILVLSERRKGKGRIENDAQKKKRHLESPKLKEEKFSHLE